MINKPRFPLTLITEHFVTVVVAATTLSAAIFTTASPANAIGPSWTERRAGCSYTCEWRVVSGTCKTVFGVKVPCPLRRG